MKKFIKFFLLFVLPIFLGFVVLELLVRDSNSLYKEKWEGYISNAKSIEVLVLGNSQAMNAIDPREFELFTYNMAFAAQSFFFDKAITLKQIESMPNLKSVLISVDYHTFYYNHSEKRDIFYHYYYDINYDNKRYFLEDFSWTYALGFKQTIREHIPKSRTNSIRGFVSSDITKWNLLNTTDGQKRVEQLESGFVNSKNGVASSLNDFIQILKTKDITPILITLPCHSYFKKHLNKHIVKNNMLAINQICDFHKIDYWNFLDKEYPDSLYHNVNHLNKYGAKKISKELNKIIVRSLNKN